MSRPKLKKFEVIMRVIEFDAIKDALRAQGYSLDGSSDPFILRKLFWIGDKDLRNEILINKVDVEDNDIIDFYGH